MMSVFSACAAVAASMIVTSSAAEPGYDTLISHRGESVDAPENTLPACKTAVARGFGFECDVYLSKDGRVFTFHDKTLARTTGGVNTNKCGDVTWDEISRLDVGGWGKWKGSKYSPTRPALLEEVLDLAVDGRKIYVEVKTGPEIVPYVKEVFRKHAKVSPENTLFISFNAKSCAELKRQMPEYKVYWLIGNVRRSGKKLIPVTLEYVMKTLKETGSDGVDMRFDPKSVTEEFIKTVKDAGYEFHVWTIDNLALAKMAFERGAQTVTTNNAKKLLDEYRNSEK
jgi:glycerophosphoryl diester phosphodiesterase